MAYNYPKVKLDEDGTFGPTLRNHKYQPAFYHNKSAASNPHKTRWKLRQSEQYEVFRIADEGEWICVHNNALFSILDNGAEVLGEDDERLAIFRIPGNVNEPYHGFPFHSSKYTISEELLDMWEERQIIDLKIRVKIAKGKI
jgi:hypothetical protein